MGRIFSYFIILLILASCKSEDGQATFRDNFRWLSGKWKGQNGNVTLWEQWRWNKTRFEGEGYEIENGDTIFSEKIRLEQFDGLPAYIVSIPFQGLMLYTGTQDSTNRWKFENVEHDFPSRIYYQQESDTTMLISLEARGEAYRGEHSYQLQRVD